MNKLTEIIVSLPPLLMGGIALLLPAAMMFDAPDRAATASVDLWILNYLFWACLPIGVALCVFTLIVSRMKKDRLLWLNVLVMGIWLALCIIFTVRSGVGI